MHTDSIPEGSVVIIPSNEQLAKIKEYLRSKGETRNPKRIYKTPNGKRFYVVCGTDIFPIEADRL